MSYILDALKKSEKEREESKEGQVSSSDTIINSGQTRHVPRSPSPKKRIGKGILIFVIMVSVGGLTIAGLIFSGALDSYIMPTKDAATITDSAKITKKEHIAAKQTKKTTKRTIAKANKQLKRPPKKLLKKRIDNSRILSKSKPPVIAEHKNIKRKNTKKLAKERVQQAARANKIAPKEKKHNHAIPKKTKIAKAKPVKGVSIKKPQPNQLGKVNSVSEKPKKAVPHFNTLPIEFRSSLLNMDINVHVYDKNPNDRFTYILSKKYQEGAKLPNGAQIMEIIPEGFILKYKGKTFIYPAF
ncbi:MAG: hypothetical protein D6B27_03110 [Gammaproteobacteria bacterium]|nr:MAG: hypothetical protein D6B27_03110 [Gammaproteobacteria bacterium]